MRIEFDAASHSYKVNGRTVPSVTDVLAPLEDFSRVPPDVLERAREFGQHVHLACDLYNRNELDWLDLDPALASYVEGWAKFLQDTGAVILASEARVAHEVLGYAGTPDVIIHMRKHVWVPDIKSTAVVPRTVGAQTAGYAAAYRHMNGGPEPKRCCIHLEPGKYTLHARSDPADWSLFISCLNVWKWKEKHNVAA